MNKITTFSQITQVKIYEQHNHNYSNLAQSQIVFYVNEQPLVLNYATQYEENPASHHGGMHEDGRTEPFPILPASA